MLLVSDAGRRRRLACAASSPRVHCVEASDEAGAMFAVAPDTLDLVVLDATIQDRGDTARLSNWRRMCPNGELLVLQPTPERDLERLRRVLERVLGAGAGGVPSKRCGEPER